MPVIFIILVAAVVGIGALVLARANEIFYVSIRDGRCLLVRGRIPPSLWRELREVVRLARIRHGAVRAVKSGGRPKLVCDGVDGGTAQRLRNAFGAQGFGHLKASAPASACDGHRNLGQLLGFAWLAWILTRR